LADTGKTDLRSVWAADFPMHRDHQALACDRRSADQAHRRDLARCHPHPGHRPGRRPAPAAGQLPATTWTHHRTRSPRAPAGQRQPDSTRPL